jgi:REP element-mobilizing transposase RayT
MREMDANPVRPEVGPYPKTVFANLKPDLGSGRPPDGRRERTRMCHTPPHWVRDGSLYFITLCCAPRGKNQLCQPAVADMLFSAARHYHESHRWYLRLMLLMPDHLHALLAPAPTESLHKLIGTWKSFVAKTTGVEWQKNFFDHRLRTDESWEEKASYIRANPLRAGLIKPDGVWPYQIQH